MNNSTPAGLRPITPALLLFALFYGGMTVLAGVVGNKQVALGPWLAVEAGIFPFLMLVTGFFYRWATIAGGSSTWGMRMMAIELRDHQGLRLTGGDAFWHTMGYTLSVAIAPVQLISILLMLITGRGQGVTDHIMGTAAINRPL